VTRRLLLFDIDGTLVLTGGAGKRSMDRAFEEVFGVPEAFAEVSMAGRTDRWLVETALDRHGVTATPERLDAFRARYLALLDAAIGEPGSGRRGVMPGVAEALTALRARDDAHLALLTGNYAGGARITLRGARSATTTPSAMRSPVRRWRRPRRAASAWPTRRMPS
jgi:phosphoglycolate phosphatase-like HAD superfamily hydrolase